MISDNMILKQFEETNDFGVLMELRNRYFDIFVPWFQASYGLDQGIAECVFRAALCEVRDRSHEFDGESFRDWFYTLAANCVPSEVARVKRLRRRKNRVLKTLAANRAT
jgi:hypothetical protein